jgi:hypothetical protein
MIDKEIRKYINRLNNKKGQESIFTRPLSETVELSKVWSEQPKKTYSIVEDFPSYRFYFIKNTLGIYVGAILDMYSDLHWYIVPKQRKNGYLTKALKESVLPHIFYYNREVQRITIQESIGKENYTNSKNVAIKIGFNSINEDETVFELNKSDFKWENDNLTEHVKSIGNERIELLKKRVNHASNILLKVSDELQIAYDDDDKLSEISFKVKDHVWKIEDLMWKYEKKE